MIRARIGGFDFIVTDQCPRNEIHELRRAEFTPKSIVLHTRKLLDLVDIPARPDQPTEEKP